jgi:hypothetical protein
MADSTIDEELQPLFFFTEPPPNALIYTNPWPMSPQNESQGAFFAGLQI